MEKIYYNVKSNSSASSIQVQGSMSNPQMVVAGPLARLRLRGWQGATQVPTVRSLEGLPTATPIWAAHVTQRPGLGVHSPSTPNYNYSDSHPIGALTFTYTVRDAGRLEHDAPFHYGEPSSRC